MSNLADSIKTTPFDHKFSGAQNQAFHCFNRFNEYVLCLKTTESDADKCKPLRQLAHSICPDDWINKWDEEIPKGTFAGIKLQAKEEKAHGH